MFGNIYDQFKGKAKEAIAFLLQKKEGEATGALHHKDIGDIDLVWGEEGTGKSDGFGLAKLEKYHPEVLDNLQNILDDMHVVQRSDNRVRLESASHQAAVRLTWDNQKKNWLLTAFEKKNSAPDNTTDTAETLKEGERNDTATPQNTVSIGKDTDKSSSVQENGGKNAETRETALRDGLIDKLRSAGIEVITDEEEAQRVLDAANGGVALSRGQKRAVETVSVSSNEEHQQTVISTADNAKVLNNLDNLAKKLDNLTQTPVKTFLGEVAKALGAEQYGSGSQYATFETKNGQIVTIRLADHNAHTSGFDYSGKDNGISIVISAKKNSGINNDGNAHIVEYYYDAIKLRRANGKPLADIVRAIQQSLYSGEFKDPTGLAEREEVNVSSTANEVKFLRTDSGEAYGFTKDGKIYIDPRKATAETPVHEFTHLWADGLRKANPKAWEQLKSELEKEKDLFDYVKSLYPELSGDDLMDEVFAHFSGRRGAERLRSEQDKMMQKANGIFDKAKITTMFDRLKNILHDFWTQARDLFAGKTGGIEKLSAEDFADMALADLIKGEKPLAEGKKETRFNKAAGLDVRTYDNSNHQTSNEERVTLGELVSGDRQLRDMSDKELDSEYMRLLDVVEKPARIDKLRSSKPVIATGEEYKGKYELNNKSAASYINDHLRDNYTNVDTGEEIKITRKGAFKVTRHDVENEAHLKSVALIPQMLEKSIFISEDNNTKGKTGFDSYRYYVVGLNIGGVDYTAKLVIGVKDGNTYYDHALTEIEKTDLLDRRDEISSSFTDKEAVNSVGKDKRLLSILQVNGEEISQSEQKMREILDEMKRSEGMIAIRTIRVLWLLMVLLRRGMLILTARRIECQRLSLASLRATILWATIWTMDLITKIWAGSLPILLLHLAETRLLLSQSVTL